MARFSEQHEILKGSRTRARRRMFFKIIIGWVVVLALLGGGIYTLIVTDALKVREVRVEGVRLADHAKVKSVLAESVGGEAPRSWFADDLTLFWLFLKPPESFLNAFPMFRKVDVVTHLFSREVVIRVAERELYGVWCIVGGECFAFDDEGVVFGKAPATYGTLVTKVTDVRTATFSAGESVLSDAEWRGRMLRTLGVLRELRLTPRAITVREPALREWEVVLAEGPTLKFSFAFAPERLDETLTTLSRRADFRALTYLDFRVQDRLYYK
ncbi:MAG: hypothetical protein V1885_03555 [Candidatus Brennerbacteria bacterium]